MATSIHHFSTITVAVNPRVLVLSTCTPACQQKSSYVWANLSQGGYVGVIDISSASALKNSREKKNTFRKGGVNR